MSEGRMLLVRRFHGVKRGGWLTLGMVVGAYIKIHHIRVRRTTEEGKNGSQTTVLLFVLRYEDSRDVLFLFRIVFFLIFFFFGFLGTIEKNI
jgi:hypothetical protein